MADFTPSRIIDERIVLERLRNNVAKEQAELRMERANWERDRMKIERDELASRVLKLQALLDREKRKRPPFVPRVFTADGQ